MDLSTPRGIFTSVALLLLGALLTFLATKYWKHRDAEDLAVRQKAAAHDAVVNRLVEVERQLALVGQAVLPISTAFQAILIKELTHMHTPRMDELLAKIGPPSTLTEKEETELADGLAQRAMDMGDMISASERDAALILPLVIKRAKAESAALALGDPTTLRLVTVSPAGEEKHTDK